MKVKKSLMPLIKCIPAVLVFAAIIVLAVIAFKDVSENANSEGLAITEKSIKRAIIICYAQEGSYPESIDYLKENYGLHVSDEYVVNYSIFASNIMPNVQVMRKQVDN